MSLPRRDTVVAALLFAAGVVCTRLPLLNSIGFESSFLFALLVTLLVGPATIRRIRQGTAPSLLRPFSPGREFLRHVRRNFFLLLPPFAILSLNALLVPNCSYTEGVAFWLLNPGITTLLVTTLAMFVAALTSRPLALYLLLVGASFAYVLWLGYYTPAIFSYNAFFGYFPGLTYDEIITIDATFLYARAIAFGYAGVLLWLVSILHGIPASTRRLWRRTGRMIQILAQAPHRVPALFVLYAIALILLHREDLGFEASDVYIQRELGGLYETQNFMIYYDTTSISDVRINRIAWEHEFRFRQILTALQLPRDERITSFIYPTPEMKHRLIGTSTTNIAKPWSRQIHLTASSLDATLKHEMTHVMAARFGVPIIKASLSTGLVEGLPMALDVDPGTRTLHEYAAAMKRSGIFPDIRALLSITGFAAQSSSVSYILAGSFCRYLLSRFGIRQLMQVYRTGDYDAVYRIPLDTLVSDWSSSLDRIRTTSDDSCRVDVAFRRPALFGKICARVLARRMKDADTIFERHDYEGAFRTYTDIHRLGGRIDALGGMLASAFRLGRFATVTSVMDSLLRIDDHPQRYLSLFLLTGDAAWVQGDTARAITLYSAIVAGDVSDGLTEAAAIRLQLLRRPDPGVFLPYLLTWQSDSLRLKVLDSIGTTTGMPPVVQLVKARLLSRMGRTAESVETLEAMRQSTGEPILERARYRLLGESLYAIEKFQNARSAFWTAMNFAGGAQRSLAISDWIDRCEWMAPRTGTRN